jgi:hypothetical protein
MKHAGLVNFMADSGGLKSLTKALCMPLKRVVALTNERNLRIRNAAMPAMRPQLISSACPLLSGRRQSITVAYS